MARVLYSATMSLDGFIAGADGDMSWLTPYLGPDPVADELLADIGALVVGNTTYGGDDPNRGTDREGAFGGQWSGPQFVVTHSIGRDAPPHITFVGNVPDAVTAAASVAGDRYVNVLGASIAAQCIDAGLLDEVLVFVAPVLLGDGVRLFSHPGRTRVALERMRQHSTALTTGMWFRVLR